MTWPSMERGHEGALCLKTLGEYCAALHADILHSVDKFSYLTPQVEKMINSMLEFQNALSTTQRWNDEIADCDAIKDMICVNNVKHREPKTFVDKDLFEQHTITCYGYTARKVVFVGESTEEDASGSISSSYEPTGRGRRGGLQPCGGLSRDDVKRQSSSK